MAAEGSWCDCMAGSAAAWHTRLIAVALAACLTPACACAAAPNKPSSGPSPAGLKVPAGPPGRPSWAPWPAALHDARHSGASVSRGPTAGTLRWRRQLEAAATPGPVVGPDGTIYAASNGGVLHALNPLTGTDLWTHDSGQSHSGDDLSASALVLEDGTVVWPTPGNKLFGLSHTGVKLWSQTLPGQPTSPASADGRRVYVGDTSGSVTALDITNNGAPNRVWTVKVGSVSYGSVVLGGGGRLYTTADSSLVAVDDTGDKANIAWRADPGDNITEVSPGLAADGTVLLGTNGSQEWAYRPDGTPLWHSPRVITYSSPSATETGLAYVADHSGTVHVFRVSDGSEAATYRHSPAQIWTSTVVDAGYHLYYGTQAGHVIGLDASGATLFDIDLGAPLDCYPALTADANLIIGDRNGTLVSIG
ncbi:PQQ-binding-like beta-propeller repeat protein [Mycobacterium sp.]|uniref:PQQ-binding-like beta-propeller repeat protein n=1 Tax=Mycobacterium sp. TaxID=1785 RepID=UPI002D32E223|nr:PQQ-binding-like beta-propeller repeat protein [Mycobacterium sp.]HZA12534.1 PQQ-binding-like beta-propeller repeat protein [Mycobacterium sp.]